MSTGVKGPCRIGCATQARRAQQGRRAQLQLAALCWIESVVALERLARVEAREGRRTSFGRIGVVRVLPTKDRRTVGAWCFVDLDAPGLSRAARSE